MATATTRTTWRRLKRNKGALIGITIIVLSILAALFAYVLAPDGSPNANRMVVEIGGQQPGYTQLFLQLPRGRKIQSASFLNRLFFGEEDKYQYIPIQSHQQKNDSLIIQKYIDEGITERVAYPITQTQWQEGALKGPYKVTSKKFHLGTDNTAAIFSAGCW